MVVPGSHVWPARRAVRGLSSLPADLQNQLNRSPYISAYDSAGGGGGGSGGGKLGPKRNKLGLCANRPGGYLGALADGFEKAASDFRTIGYAGSIASVVSLLGADEATPELLLITRSAFATSALSAGIADSLRAAGGDTRDISVDDLVNAAAEQVLPGESAIAQSSR